MISCGDDLLNISRCYETSLIIFLDQVVELSTEQWCAFLYQIEYQ